MGRGMVGTKSRQSAIAQGMRFDIGWGGRARLSQQAFKGVKRQSQLDQRDLRHTPTGYLR
jgi:hypothetical protein